MSLSRINTVPVYIYTHKDGRKGSDSGGAWYAIKKALGNDEAMKIIDEADPIRWGFIEGVRKADLILKSEIVGTFQKIILC